MLGVIGSTALEDWAGRVRVLGHRPKRKSLKSMEHEKAR